MTAGGTVHSSNPGGGSRGRALRILAVATLSMSGAVMTAGLTFVLAVQIREHLAMGAFEFGVVSTAYSAGIAVCSAPLGRLADRLGWPRAVLLSLAWSTAMLAAVALLAGSFASLLTILLLAGANVAFAVPATTLALTRELSPDHRGLSFGVKEASISLTLLLSGLAVPSVALTVGWRWAFALGTIVPVLAAAVLLMDPSDLRRTRGSAVPGVAAPGRRRGALVPSTLRPLAIGAALAAASVAGVVAFAVLSAVDAGLPPAGAGLLIAAASIAGMVSDMAVGMVADRRGSGGLPEAAAVLLVGAVGYGILVLHTPLAVVAGTVLGYAFGWAFSGLLHLGAVTAHSESPATATGVVQVGAGVGLTVGPVTFGTLVDVSGYPLAWGTMAVLAVAAAATVRAGATKLSRAAAGSTPAGVSP